MILDKTYWNHRWETGETGWDIGYASTPIKAYIDQLEDKSIDILIPGCGNAYEGEYLWKNGFKNTYLIDVSKNAFERFKQRFPEFPESNLFCEDFFNHDKQYDLIFEQTFFCALNPKLRKDYVKKMHGLLKPKGQLVGVLFHDHLNDDHPPFGGFLEDYKPLFKDHFEFKAFEICKNSIKPRANREVFINLRKL